MKLIINGNETETMASTISSLLEELHILPGRIAIEVNNSVIKRAGHSSYLFKDGDVVEIVNFVGGG
jgi:sulfur carrier protein